MSVRMTLLYKGKFDCNITTATSSLCLPTLCGCALRRYANACFSYLRRLRPLRPRPLRRRQQQRLHPGPPGRRRIHPDLLPVLHPEQPGHTAIQPGRGRDSSLLPHLWQPRTRISGGAVLPGLAHPGAVLRRDGRWVRGVGRGGRRLCGERRGCGGCE